MFPFFFPTRCPSDHLFLGMVAQKPVSLGSVNLDSFYRVLFIESPLAPFYCSHVYLLLIRRSEVFSLLLSGLPPSAVLSRMEAREFSGHSVHNPLF